MTLIPSNAMLITAFPYALFVFAVLFLLRRKRRETRRADRAAPAGAPQADGGTDDPHEAGTESAEPADPMDRLWSVLLYVIPFSLLLVIAMSGHQVVIVGAQEGDFANRYRLFESSGLTPILGALVGKTEDASEDLVSFVEANGVPDFREVLLVNQSDAEVHFVWFAYMLPEVQEDPARVLEVNMQQTESLAVFAPGEIALVDRQARLYLGCSDRPPEGEEISEEVEFVGWLTEVFVEECPEPVTTD
jgi:hypothetical protein